MSARSRAGAKPLDVGTGVVCASFGRGGAWLSFGAPHPGHGFIELSGLPPFDESQRGRPDVVRAYRGLMIEDRYAFLAVEASEDALSAGARRVSTAALAVRAAPGDRHISEEIRLTTAAGGPPPAAVWLRFDGRLDRPALAEITESDPPAPTGAVTRLSAEGRVLRVTAPELPAEVTIAIDGPAGEWAIERSTARLALEPVEPGRHAVVRITCRLEAPDPAPGAAAGPTRAPRIAVAPSSPGELVRCPDWLVIPDELRPDVENVRDRAVRYVTECTAVRVAPDRVAILTDHRILPLSWTRDAYYQALLLLHAGDASDVDGVDRIGLVADHLRWLWLSCDRSDGTWARSHHPDGRRKDERFQADQQLYPLLELADFWRSTGTLPELPAGAPGWRHLVEEVIGVLAASLSREGLLSTQENAADDDVSQPYVVSTQILAWYCLRRLEELRRPLHLAMSPATLAATARDAALRRFAVAGPDGPIWAYSVDGRGDATLYHDANDLPTAFAPLWGFCAADDPLWRGTMRFAFSSHNDGYASGPWGGLGSRHTRGTWSLGLIQEWVAMSVAGDREAAASALRKLAGIAFMDGSLPEASDPETGRAAARHWFAWPGALVGALLGGAFGPAVPTPGDVP